MKKRLYIIYIFLVAVSCCRLDEGMTRTEEGRVMCFNAFFYDSDTRTELQSDGSVFWSSKDSIAVIPLLDTLAVVGMGSDIASSSASATFKGSCSSASEYFAAYPFSAVEKAVKVVSLYAKDWKPAVLINVPATQIAEEGSFANGAFPSIAITDSDVLEFKNICGGAKIRVSRSDVESIEFSSLGGEFIAGTATAYFGSDSLPVSYSNSGVSSVTFYAPDGGCFIPGKDYYISLLPTSLNSGFKMVFNAENSVGTYEYKDTVTIHRSVFGRLYDMDKKAGYVDDESILSAAGTANCYIVNKAGTYKFKSKVKGCSTEPLDGVPVVAEVLWESFGTDVTPAVGDIVKDVFCSGGKVSFTASGNDGNAVIAVKDASNNILWSWHIWVCNGFDPNSTAHVYNNNAGIMMDRNLGATSAEPGNIRTLGLLYQWGRKDPFLCCYTTWLQAFHGQKAASSTISWPIRQTSSSTIGTIEYSVAHPTTIILSNSNNHDWLYSESSTNDNTRWQTLDKSKGIYDPCPYGWRVPNGGDNGVWSTAFGKSSSFKGNYNFNYRGMVFSTNLGNSSNIFYPCAGYRNDSGVIDYTGCYGYYWSCTPADGNEAYCFWINDYSLSSSTSVYPALDNCRSYSKSVRCMKVTE